MILKAKPKRPDKEPENLLRKICYRIQKYKHFEKIIYFCILCNTLVLALSYHGEPTFLEILIELSNSLFTAIFTIEALVKILALGRDYFKDNWNNFDLSIVIGTYIGLFLGFVFSFDIGP